MAREAAKKEDGGSVAAAEPKKRTAHPLRQAAAKYADCARDLESVRTRMRKNREAYERLEAEESGLLDMSAEAKRALDAVDLTK